MPKLRNARSLVKRIEMPSGLQLAMKGQLFCLHKNASIISFENKANQLSTNMKLNVTLCKRDDNKTTKESYRQIIL